MWILRVGYWNGCRWTDRRMDRNIGLNNRTIDPMAISAQNTKQLRESPRTRRKKQREGNRRAREKKAGKPGQAGGGKQQPAAAAKGGKGGFDRKSVGGRWSVGQ